MSGKKNLNITSDDLLMGGASAG